MADLDLGTITVKIEAAVAEFQKQLADVSGSLEGLSAKAKPVAVAMSAAFAGATAALGLSLKEFAEAETAGLRAAAAFKAAGAGFDPTRANEFAMALERLTGFGDDTVIAAQGILGSFKLTQAQTEALLPKIADLANMMGMDLPDAAALVGRSVQSGTNALQRQGLVMSETQQEAFKTASETERLAMMMDLLQGKAGGASEALANTFGRATKDAQNALGNFSEEIGSLIAGPVGDMARVITNALRGMTDWLKNLTPEMRDWIGKALLMGTAALGIAAAFAGFLVVLPSLAAGLSMVAGALGTVLGALTPLLLPILAITAALAGIVTIVGQIKQLKSIGAFSTGPQTPEQAQAEAELKQRTGGTAGGILTDAFKQGLDTITAPIKELAASVLPDFSGQMKNASDKATLAASGLDAVGKRGAAKPMDFAAMPDTGGFEMDFTEAGVFVDAGIASIEAASKQVDQAAAQRLQMVDKVADSVMTDVAIGFLGAGGDLVANMETGELTMAGEFYNAFAGFGPDVAGAVSGVVASLPGALSSIGEGLANFGKVFASNLVGKLGDLGDTIGAGIQGAQAGGPFGALAAVFVDLLSKAPSFMKIVETLNEAMGKLTQVFEPLLQAIQPLVTIVVELIGWIGGVLGDVLQALMPAITGIIQAIGQLLPVIMDVLTPILAFLVRIITPLARIIGTVAQIIAAVLTPIFQILGIVLEPIIAILDSVLIPILAVISTLLEAFSGILNTIIGILGPVFLPVLQIFADGVGLVARVIAVIMYGVLAVVKGLLDVWNGIVSAIASVFDKLADISVFGKHPLGFLGDWADGIEEAKVSTGGISNAMDDLADIIENGTVPAAEAAQDGFDAASDSMCDTPSSASLCESVNGVGDAAKEATASLLNVPSGFKVEAARFAATTAMPIASTAMDSALGDRGVDARTFVIERVDIKSDDPERIWASIKKIIEWDNYSQNGTTVGGTNPYAINKVGG